MDSGWVRWQELIKYLYWYTKSTIIVCVGASDIAWVQSEGRKRLDFSGVEVEKYLFVGDGKVKARF